MGTTGREGAGRCEPSPHKWLIRGWVCVGALGERTDQPRIELGRLVWLHAYSGNANNGLGCPPCPPWTAADLEITVRVERHQGVKWSS